MKVARKLLLGEALQIVIALAGVILAVMLLQGCAPSKSPAPVGTDVEAGIGVVTNGCSLLEGITQNQTVITICATVEEIATIAALVATFIRSSGQDAGVCTPLGTTGVCASKAEIGPGIQLVLAKRHALLVHEVGATP